MKIIVGLGNPGMKYVHTRHNAGFDTLNLFAQKNDFRFSRKGNTMLISENNYKGEKLILVKPLTYMNLSGQAVASVMGTFKAEPKDIMVISDDMDLPCGKIRIRAKGSAGGHNGIKSVINCIGSQEFSRMRIGIGRDENAIDFVLGRFSESDRKIMEEAYEKAAEALLCWIEKGTEYTMNRYNG